MSHTVNAPSASPVAPASILNSYQAFKESVGRDIVRFDEEAHQKISEFTHARALLKKGGASEEAIKLIQAKVVDARHHKKQKWSYARSKVENHFLDMVSRIRYNILEPRARILKRALRSEKTKPVFTEACARLPHQKEMLLQAIAILEHYKKDPITSSWMRPSVSATESKETFETYLQERYKLMTHFAKTVSDLSCLFKTWKEMSARPTSASNQEVRMNKQTSLSEPHKAAQDCINTGHRLVIKGLNEIIDGTSESALSHFSHGLRHWDLAQAFLLEPPSSRALSLALDMDVNCRNALTRTTWKAVENIQQAVDRPAASTPPVTRRRPSA